MSRSKKKKRKGRAMRPTRLEAVRQIEKTQPSKTATQAPRQEKQVDSATQKQIAELRQLGLSVSVNASPEKMRSLRQEFDVVTKYVREVIQTMAPNDDAIAKLSEQQITRFTAMLFGNGQLISGIAMSQKARSALALDGTLQTKTPEFKQVARLLRMQFPHLLPAKTWLPRLWGG